MAKPTPVRKKAELIGDVLTRMRDGASLAKACRDVGLPKETLRNWRQRDKLVDELVTLSWDKQTEEVEAALFRRAVGYDREVNKSTVRERADGPIETTTERTTKHYPPEVAAAIFWLVRRAPADWPPPNALGEQAADAGENLREFVHALQASIAPSKPEAAADDSQAE